MNLFSWPPHWFRLLKERMYLWLSLCTLYLLACQVSYRSRALINSLACWFCSINIYTKETFSFFFFFFFCFEFELLCPQPCWSILYQWRAEKGWLMSCLILFVTNPELVFMTSWLIQTVTVDTDVLNLFPLAYSCHVLHVYITTTTKSETKTKLNLCIFNALLYSLLLSLWSSFLMRYIWVYVPSFNFQSG